MAKHKEGKVETYFKEQVEAYGGETRKARWLCRRGAPDQFWMLGGHYGFAEIKAPGKPLQPHQEREIKRLRKQRVMVYVIDTTDGVDDFIRMFANDRSKN